MGAGFPQDQTWMENAAERLGASVPAFRSAYWRYRHDYDADLPAHEYWRLVIAASRFNGAGGLSEPDLRRLITADVDSWVDHHHEVWEVAAGFRRAGGRTALLSNSGPEVMARARADHPLEGRFDAVVISCEVGLAKPDPRTFRLCLERLGLPPHEALFVDDRCSSRAGTRSTGCGR